jgi:uncharacterized integral membrane protein
MSANVPPGSAPRNQPPHRTAGDRFSDALARPKLILGLLITIAALWFIFANTHRVRIHMWLTWVSAQLWAVLLLTFLAGALADRLMARRRRKARR